MHNYNTINTYRLVLNQMELNFVGGMAYCCYSALLVEEEAVALQVVALLYKLNNINLYLIILKQ